MDRLAILDFKISGQRIKKKEKEMLDAYGFRWCNSCEQTKISEEFYSDKSSYCKCCDYEISNTARKKKRQNDLTSCLSTVKKRFNQKKAVKAKKELFNKLKSKR